MQNRYTFNFIYKYAGFIIVLFLLGACNSSQKISKDYNYFQQNLDNNPSAHLKELVIQNNDLLSIQVNSNSLNQDQTLVFNLPSSLKGYNVNTDGMIDFPVIGFVKATGLTKIELQKVITEKLTAYIKDPIVVIRSLQFKVNVLGEVGSPGTKSFDGDAVTIIDAIGAAGDITVDGTRTDVMVIREENAKKKYYHVDMRTGNLFQSPVYQLQPNDIVYVAANSKKLKDIDASSRALDKTRIILSTASFFIGLALLVIRFTKN